MVKNSKIDWSVSKNQFLTRSGLGIFNYKATEEI